MKPDDLVKLMSEKLILLNQSVAGKMSVPNVWKRTADEENDPIRKITWENEDNGLLEMSIYDDGVIEFEVVSGEDETLAAIIGDVPSELYGWDAFPMVVLNQFCKE